MTKNREAILSLINESNDHLTVDDIYKIINTDENTVSLATIYNNVNALADAGLIRRVTVDGQPEHYDKTIRHDHLVCSKCGSLTDVYYDDLTKKLSRAVGVSIDSYDLRIYYVCDKCKEKGE